VGHPCALAIADELDASGVLPAELLVPVDIRTLLTRQAPRFSLDGARSGQPLFKSITDADIQQAVETAEAIGDDTIQQKSGMQVNPDKFTHGTSAQRKQWFLRGYQSGDPKNQCDTFGNGV